MVDKIYIRDIGTRLRTTLNIDLAGYSSISYKIKKPSGTILTKTCSVEDETNGIIYYDAIDGDLDEVGSYRIQADINFTNGNHNESVTRSFEVYEKFK
jgi:hypothetical protein